MSAIDSPFYQEIMDLGTQANPDGSEAEQEAIGRRALCFERRKQRQTEMGFRPEAEQCITKIPRSEAIRMLQEGKEDLQKKLKLIEAAELLVEEDHPELKEILT